MLQRISLLDHVRPLCVDTALSDEAVYHQWTDSFERKEVEGGGGLVTEYFQTSNEDAGCSLTP